MAIISISKTDVAWNYVGTAFNVCASFILLPILMVLLENELLSLWYIFLSIGAIVTVFDFGLGPSLSKNITNAWSGVNELQSFGISENRGNGVNHALLNSVLGASRWIYLLLSSIVLLVLATIGSCYVVYVASSLDNLAFLPAWAIYCLAVFTNMYYGYYVSFLRGLGEITACNKISIASKVIQIALSAAFLLIGLGLLSVSIAFFVSGLSMRLLSKRKLEATIGKSVHAEYSVKVSWSETVQVLRILWPNTWRDGLVSISEYITTQATTVVCSLFLSLSDVGIYAISMQMVVALCNVSGSFWGSTRPEMQNRYIAYDYKAVERLVSKSMLAFYIFFAIGVVGVIFVAAPILSMIAPKYEFDNGVILLIAAYLLVMNRFKLYATFCSVVNDLTYFKAFVLAGLMGLLFAVLALRFIAGAIPCLLIPQIIVQLSYNFWKWPRYAQRKFNSDGRQMIATEIDCLKRIVRIEPKSA